MKIRGTPTDSLADVIQSLQLIHKSGLLTVERGGPGNASELGRIAFRDGQIQAADLGTLKGSEALKRLMSWQTCHFLFEPIASTASSTGAHPIPRIAEQKSQATERRSRELPLNEYSPTSIIPYRAQHMLNVIPDFQRLGLSRMHRQLFMLIDGKRSPQELARLIGRSPQEVLGLLSDLERFSLISH